MVGRIINGDATETWERPGNGAGQSGYPLSVVAKQNQQRGAEGFGGIHLILRSQGLVESLVPMLATARMGPVRVHRTGDEFTRFLIQAASSGELLPAAVMISADLAGVDSVALCQELIDPVNLASSPAVVVVAGDCKLSEADLDTLTSNGVAEIVLGEVNAPILLSAVARSLAVHSERVACARITATFRQDPAEKQIMESKLRYLVSQDELTGLLNRKRLYQALEVTATQAGSAGLGAALFLINLDQFQRVNEIYGYSVGDRLLAQVARYLSAVAGEARAIARTGSDQFALVLDKIELADAQKLAERWLSGIRNLRLDNDTRFPVTTASIGIALFGEGGTSNRSQDILSRAEQACYLAKRQGGNTLAVFREDAPEIRLRKHDQRLLPEIRRALAEDRFHFMFQPVFDADSGLPAYHEVLLRLGYNGSSEVSPQVLVPAAERLGLARALDLWVLDRVIDYLSDKVVTHQELRLSVNLSGQALQDGSVYTLVKNKLELNNLDPSRLLFELKETSCMAEFAKTRENIAKLSAMGCQFAIDDFGSGFSSYNYIKNLPAHILKIDGAFIANIANDPTDRKLVAAMVELGHSLGKVMVAEWVQDPQSFAIVKELGVDYCQGNFLGRAQTNPIHR
ncbi:MAG: bifunctional diguanylate cyclase/phosphodiesterase [Chromatiales bacterium]|nr:bifunctional diguanylate cyclase/phosphodiesterase [Chromatiales bacterium]